jgi:hypothetical protein
MALQALRYEQGGAPAKKLDEFWASAAWPIATKTGNAVLRELERMRKKK